MEDATVPAPAYERSRVLGLLLGLIALGGFVLACTNLSQTSPPAVPSIPDASATLPPASDSTNPWLSGAQLDRAVALRKSLGLRTDDAWLRFVATSTQAIANAARYSIPITDGEIAAITNREAILADLEQFRTSHLETWAGYYFDGDTVVVLLIDPTGVVAQQLRAAVPGPLAVKPARWSLQHLNDLATRIADDPWLQARYQLLSAGADVEHNSVAIEVSTKDQTAPATIAAHYNLGEELVVTIDGTGPQSEAPNG
jgi:hypothetical protein